MKKKIAKYFLISTCLISSILFFGCANNSIQFNRESKVSELMNSIKKPEKKGVLKKSSGMIIYKDESSQDSSNMRFGPGDINFDMPIRMK